MAAAERPDREGRAWEIAKITKTKRQSKTERIPGKRHYDGGNTKGMRERRTNKTTRQVDEDKNCRATERKRNMGRRQ